MIVVGTRVGVDDDKFDNPATAALAMWAEFCPAELPAYAAGCRKTRSSRETTGCRSPVLVSPEDAIHWSAHSVFVRPSL